MEPQAPAPLTRKPGDLSKWLLSPAGTATPTDGQAAPGDTFKPGRLQGLLIGQAPAKPQFDPANPMPPALPGPRPLPEPSLVDKTMAFGSKIDQFATSPLLPAMPKEGQPSGQLINPEAPELGMDETPFHVNPALRAAHESLVRPMTSPIGVGLGVLGATIPKAGLAIGTTIGANVLKNEYAQQDQVASQLDELETKARQAAAAGNVGEMGKFLYEADQLRASQVINVGAGLGMVAPVVAKGLGAAQEAAAAGPKINKMTGSLAEDAALAGKYSDTLDAQAAAIPDPVEQPTAGMDMSVQSDPMLTGRMGQQMANRGQGLNPDQAKPTGHNIVYPEIPGEHSAWPRPEAKQAPPVEPKPASKTQPTQAPPSQEPPPGYQPGQLASKLVEPPPAAEPAKAEPAPRVEPAPANPAERFKAMSDQDVWAYIRDQQGNINQGRVVDMAGLKVAMDEIGSRQVQPRPNVPPRGPRAQETPPDKPPVVQDQAAPPPEGAPQTGPTGPWTAEQIKTANQEDLLVRYRELSHQADTEGPLSVNKTEWTNIWNELERRSSQPKAGPMAQKENRFEQRQLGWESGELTPTGEPVVPTPKGRMTDRVLQANPDAQTVLRLEESRGLQSLWIGPDAHIIGGQPRVTHYQLMENAGLPSHSWDDGKKIFGREQMIRAYRMGNEMGIEVFGAPTAKQSELILEWADANPGHKIRAEFHSQGKYKGQIRGNVDDFMESVHQVYTKGNNIKPMFQKSGEPLKGQVATSPATPHLEIRQTASGPVAWVSPEVVQVMDNTATALAFANVTQAVNRLEAIDAMSLTDGQWQALQGAYKGLRKYKLDTGYDGPIDFLKRPKFTGQQNAIESRRHEATHKQALYDGKADLSKAINHPLVAAVGEFLETHRGYQGLTPNALAHEVLAHVLSGEILPSTKEGGASHQQMAVATGALNGIYAELRTQMSPDDIISLLTNKTPKMRKVIDVIKFREQVRKEAQAHRSIAIQQPALGQPPLPKADAAGSPTGQAGDKPGDLRPGASPAGEGPRLQQRSSPRTPATGFLTYRSQLIKDHPNVNQHAIRPAWEITHQGKSFKDATRGLGPELTDQVYELVKPEPIPESDPDFVLLPETPADVVGPKVGPRTEPDPKTAITRLVDAWVATPVSLSEMKESGFIDAEGQGVAINKDHHQALAEAGMMDPRNLGSANWRDIGEAGGSTGRLAKALEENNLIRVNHTQGTGPGVQLATKPTLIQLDMIQSLPKGWGPRTMKITYDLYDNGKRIESKRDQPMEQFLKDVNKVYDMQLSPRELRPMEAGFLNIMSQKRAKPLPTDAWYSNILKDRAEAKEGPSLVEWTIGKGHNFMVNYVDKFHDLHQSTFDAAKRGLIWSGNQDPYKVATIVYGGWGGPIEVAMNKYGKIAKSIAKEGLLQHFTKWVDINAYQREWTIVKDKVNKLTQRINNSPNDPRVAEWKAQRKNLEENIGNDEVAPGKRTEAQLAQDLIDIEQDLTPAELVKVKAHANQVYDLTREALEELHNWEIISDESYQEMLLHPNHVSLKRIIAEHDPNYSPSAFSVKKQNVVFGMKGSALSNVDPMEASARAHAMALRIAGRNWAAKTIANWKQIDPAAPIRELASWEKADPDMGTIHYLDKGKTRSFEVPSSWADAVQVSNAAEVNIIGQAALGLIRNVLQKTATGWNLAFIFKNVIRDNKDLRAFSPGYRPYYPLDSLKMTMLFADTVNKMLRDPGFKEAYLKSGVAYSTFQRNFTPEEFVNPKTRLTPKTVVQRVFHDIAAFNSFMEEAHKATGWRWNVLHGMDPIDAIFYGRQAGSPDFGVGGLKAKQMGLLYPFFNPSIQGTSRDVKFISGQLEHPDQAGALGPTQSKTERFVQPSRPASYKKDNLRKLVWMLAGSAAVTMALARYNNQYLNDDDGLPEKSHESDSERKNYTTIYLPEVYQTSKGEVRHIAIRLPKTHLEQLIKNPMEAIVEGFWGQQQISKTQLVLNTLSGLLPGQVDIKQDNPFSSFGLGLLASLSPALKELPQQLANRDFALDSPMVTKGQQGLEPHMQYRPTTAKWAIEMAEVASHQGVKLSPVRMEHFINAMVSGVGEQASTMADFFIEMVKNKPSQIYPYEGPEKLSKIPGVGPIIRAFTGSIQDNQAQRLEEKFYNSAADAAVAAQSFNQQVKNIASGGQDKAIRYIRETATDPSKMALIALSGRLSQGTKILSIVHQYMNAVAQSNKLSDDQKKLAMNKLHKGYMVILRQSNQEIDLVEKAFKERPELMFQVAAMAGDNLEDTLGLGELYDPDKDMPNEEN